MLASTLPSINIGKFIPEKFLQCFWKPQQDHFHQELSLNRETTAPGPPILVKFLELGSVLSDSIPESLSGDQKNLMRVFE